MSSKYTVTRDPIVKGLQYRDYPDGRRMYYMYYNCDKRERRPKIGDAKYLTLSEARKRCNAILGALARGEDPAPKASSAVTVDDLFTEVWTEHWNAERYHRSGWGNEVFGNYQRNLKDEFGHLPLSKLTRGRIYSWHLSLKDNPYAANRSLEVLSKMLSHAVLKEYISQNPCTGIAAHPETSRERYASKDELKKLGTILSSDASPQAAFILLLLYTGARPSAIERADFSRIDELDDVGIVRFFGKSSGDTGNQEALLLPPQALAIIRKVEPCKAMPKNYWERIRKEIGAEDLWARDLRRTFATIARSSGVPTSIVSALLGHTDGSRTTSIYAKLTESAAIDAVKKIAEEMELCLRS
jgi:integrase